MKYILTAIAAPVVLATKTYPGTHHVQDSRTFGTFSNRLRQVMQQIEARLEQKGIQQ